MTRYFSYATLAAVICAAPLSAGTIPADMDTDGNGTLSFQEMQTAFPTMSEATFSLIDTNSDGEADESEITAATEAGYLVISG